MVAESQLVLVDALCHTAASDESHNKGEYSDQHQMKFFRTMYTILHDNKKLLEDSIDLVDSFRTGASLLRYFECEKPPTDSKSRRIFAKVKGSRPGTEYLCLARYCSCPSFANKARQTSSSVICKHLLALKIGVALKIIIPQQLPIEKFMEYMCYDGSI